MHLIDTLKIFPVLLGMAFIAPQPALAVDAKLQIAIDLPKTADQHVETYRCEDDTELSVTYIDAAPNFLAILPWEDNDLIFVGVAGVSNARYVSGPLALTVDDKQASLVDVSSEKEVPLAQCTAVTDTP